MTDYEKQLHETMQNMMRSGEQKIQEFHRQQFERRLQNESLRSASEQQQKTLNKIDSLSKNLEEINRSLQAQIDEYKKQISENEKELKHEKEVRKIEFIISSLIGILGIVVGAIVGYFADLEEILSRT